MSRLEDVSLPFRKCAVAKNDFTDNDQYSTGHPDALSTGDEDGKGELNGSIGGKTDIKTRNCEITKNKFQQDRQYDASTA
ncbi:MAG: hypothetical protein WC428_00405 [Candidatus Paceibacterota bacterium]